MTPKQLLAILTQAGKLKTTPRHCFTAPDRAESVADHSWRIALMAMLLTGIPEFQELDMDRVIRMCLIHDLGESFTGDIPTFLKSNADGEKEDALMDRWVAGFPQPQRQEWQGLLKEMDAIETPEAKLYKALDKLEAVISHNESDISTWLPLEYELQLSYGKENVSHSPYLSSLSETIDWWTREKIEQEGQKSSNME